MRKDSFVSVEGLDITFDMPNNEGRMFRELESAAGSELRAYTLQAPFTPMPAQSIVCYSGITN